LSHLTNTRYSDLKIKQDHIEFIKGEKVTDFLIKTHQEISSILKEHYHLSFERVLRKLEEITLKVVKASKICLERNSAFQMFALDYMIGRTGTLKVLEINAFPNISTHASNPKKEGIYSEVLQKMSNLIAGKVHGTKRKLLESAINLGEINELFAIENYDL